MLTLILIVLLIPVVVITALLGVAVLVCLFSADPERTRRSETLTDKLLHSLQTLLRCRGGKK